MKQQLKRGFTLVEIMIVVVIIGLLAALAIPAFKKVRNNAIEKTLVNDARQISSAVQQYCSENATTSAPVGQMGKYINGGKLSSGVALSPDGTSGLAAGTDLVTGGGATELKIEGTKQYFFLGHAQYDKSLSSNSVIQTAGGYAITTGIATTNSIKFSTVDGQPHS